MERLKEGFNAMLVILKVNRGFESLNQGCKFQGFLFRLITISSQCLDQLGGGDKNRGEGPAKLDLELIICIS